MKNKNLLNFGFDDDNVTKGVKPNEPNIAVKVLEKKERKYQSNFISLPKKEKIIRLNIISSKQTENMLIELKQLNYKINRSKIYRDAVKKIYEELIKEIK